MSDHRNEGYKLLRGQGLEIGALHQPALLPECCTVRYCDIVAAEEIIKHFPELKIEDLVHVDYIANLDTEGLSQFDEGSFDFVILNHVIEHTANPIKTVKELFRVVHDQGLVVISAPDKNFTFDSKRSTTTFEHLLDEYQRNVTEVSDEHYIDFLQGVHPEAFQSGEEHLNKIIEEVKGRREHAHVWESTDFSRFLNDVLNKVLNINAVLLFESHGDDNKFEYFSVWQKRA